MGTGASKSLCVVQRAHSSLPADNADRCLRGGPAALQSLFQGVEREHVRVLLCQAGGALSVLWKSTRPVK